MSAFCYETQIAKSPADVYAALTTKQGIQGWWTPDCDVPSQVGDLLKVRFGEMFHTYEIKSLLPYEEVTWNCVEHFHNMPGLTKFDEWVGTRLSFRLLALEEGTQLLFEHEGLTEQLECYPHCSERWPFFLGVSLKEYVETGTGKPYIDQEPAAFDT